jgi:CspA family cold shock protein
MPTGTIKWFNNTKGWGFISPDDGKDEVFIHYSAILEEGYKKLREKQRVQYTVKTRNNRLYAIEVKPLLEKTTT